MKKRKYFVPLKHLLKYSNNELIASFCREYSVHEKEAKIIFKDLLRFLWLDQYLKSKKSSKASYFAIWAPHLIIDKMWHSFILRSADYEQFCNTYFGEFIHHFPESALKKQSHPDRFKLHWEKQIDLTLQYLGPTVLRRWYLQYPKKYSQIKIVKRMLKSAA